MPAVQVAADGRLDGSSDGCVVVGEDSVSQIKSTENGKVSGAKQAEAAAIDEMQGAKAAASEADKMLQAQEKHVLDAKQVFTLMLL